MRSFDKLSCAGNVPLDWKAAQLHCFQLRRPTMEDAIEINIDRGQTPRRRRLGLCTEARGLLCVGLGWLTGNKSIRQTDNDASLSGLDLSQVHRREPRAIEPQVTGWLPRCFTIWAKILDSKFWIFYKSFYACYWGLSRRHCQFVTPTAGAFSWPRPVFDRRTSPVLRLTYSWWVTTYGGKPSGHPTRPTQPCILSGSINE